MCRVIADIVTSLGFELQHHFEASSGCPLACGGRVLD